MNAQTTVLSILCLGNSKQLKQRWILPFKSYFKLIIVKFGIVIFDGWTLQRIVNPIMTGGGALCARRIFEAIFLQVFVKHYGLIFSDF